jgi:predicted O-methyltransferase YrrM
MYWEKIEGWFTYNELYQEIVNNSSNNSVFIEIGTWKGQSTVFMAEKIKESSKHIKFYAIDTFEGSDEHKNELVILNKTLYKEYLKNIEPVKDYIITIKGNSNKVHEQFKNESIDFIFIDGDHTLKGITSDLKNWYPKIKSNGIIAGHDYLYPDIKSVVDIFFSFKAKYYHDNCWIYKKL